MIIDNILKNSIHAIFSYFQDLLLITSFLLQISLHNPKIVFACFHDTLSIYLILFDSFFILAQFLIIFIFPLNQIF